MFESILLGLLQGLAEFLPISSSGHLVLGKHFLNVQEAGMFFDIMLHAGTLLSIFVVFRKKIFQILAGALHKEKEAYQMILYIVLASIPTAIIGIGFKKPIEALFENPRAVCFALLVTGVLLFLTQWTSSSKNAADFSPKPMNGWRAFIVGIIQGFACIPGISRSGSTTSVMLFLGIERKYAGEFTFLMSIPAVGGAALLDFKKWLSCRTDVVSDICADAGTFSIPLLVGMLVAFICGIFALKWLMAFVQKGKLHYFSYYVWAAGILGLIFLPNP